MHGIDWPATSTSTSTTLNPKITKPTVTITLVNDRMFQGIMAQALNDFLAFLLLQAQAQSAYE